MYRQVLAELATRTRVEGPLLRRQARRGSGGQHPRRSGPRTCCTALGRRSVRPGARTIGWRSRRRSWPAEPADRRPGRGPTASCHPRAMLHVGVVALGVTDVDRAARFWCEALDYRRREGGFGGWTTVLEPRSGDGTKLAMQRSETTPPALPRIHLDLHVGSADGAGGRGRTPRRARRRAGRLGPLPGGPRLRRPRRHRGTTGSASWTSATTRPDVQLTLHIDRLLEGRWSRFETSSTRSTG